jgi:hypothetical protein
MGRLLLSILLLVPLLSLLPTAQAVQPANLPPERAAQPTDLPPEGFMGMVVRDPHYEWRTNPDYPGANEAFMDEMGRNLEAAGVEWVRLEFRSESEKSDVPGQVRLEQYDYFINTVAPRHGLKVLALLATQLVHAQHDNQIMNRKAVEEPYYYRTGQYIDPEEFDLGIRTDHPLYGGNVNTYASIFLDNALAIARRFPYDGSKGIAAFEILNEENRYIGGEGRGLEPHNVAELLTKFYRIYRRGGNATYGSASQDVKIILGGIHPGRCDDCMTTSGSRMSDRQYLDAVYASPAFTTYKATYGRFPLDGVGYHPYPDQVALGLVDEYSAFNELPRIPQRMLDMRAVMTRHGDTGNKIWVTEIGERGAPRDIENQRRQADFMKSVYWMLWRQRDFVQNVFWFKYEDFAVPENPDATGPENWGVVRLVPRTPTAECPSCEYSATGEVQVKKQSFWTYRDISQGIGLQEHELYMPFVARGP